MERENKSPHVSDRLTDLALGELHPKRELELLAHAAECEACRNTYNHAKSVRGDVDRVIEGFVSGEPSPQFAAKLRARIAAEAASERSIWDIRWLGRQPSPRFLAYGIGALALCTLVAALSLLLTSRRADAPPVAQLNSPSIAQPSSPDRVTQCVEGVNHHRNKLAPASVASRNVPRTPEVLVPKEQLAALTQFYDAVQDGRVDGAQVRAAQREMQEPLMLKPIEIAPLEISADSDAGAKNGPGLF